MIPDNKDLSPEEAEELRLRRIKEDAFDTILREEVEEFRIFSKDKKLVPPKGHESATKRSLEFHKIVANDLTTDDLTQAKALIQDRLKNKQLHPEWAKRWLDLLSLPLTEIKQKIIEDNEEMNDLRQISPLSSKLSKEERWTIILNLR